MMKRVTAFGVATVLVFGLAVATYSQYDYPPSSPARPQGTGVKAQLATAITHAGFAANGDSLGYIRQHLGHALNCLEGPKGPNFNRAWGNVCQGQGNGILVDLKTTAGGAAFLRVAEHADSLASSGVKSADQAEAKIAAKAVGALLTVIQNGLK
jgi:hypothetical protein